MGHVIKKYLPTLMVWCGMIMVAVGIYLWLGLAAMLIIGGLWIFVLGALSDIVRNKKVSQPVSQPEEPKE